MSGISQNLANEIADNWEATAANPELHSERRQTLRECADVVRMLGNLMPDCPRATRLHGPLRFCPDCPGNNLCELKKMPDWKMKQKP